MTTLTGVMVCLAMMAANLVFVFLLHPPLGIGDLNLFVAGLSGGMAGALILFKIAKAESEID